MIKPIETAQERSRLDELYSYNILDTMEEEDFDFLTQMASEICDTKISLISLITSERQWFKSHHGLEIRETAKEYAFCAHALHSPYKPFIVEDSSKDERFFDNPLVVGEPHVVFYAGIPLVTQNGFALGTLCAIDDNPKSLSEEQIDKLKMLASQVMNLLELRKNTKQLEIKNQIIEKTTKLFSESQKLANIGAWEMDLETGKTVWTDHVYVIHEVEPGFDHNKSNGLDFYHPEDRPIISRAIERTLAEDIPFDVTCRFITAKKNLKWVRATGGIWREEDGKKKLIGAFQDVTDSKLAQIKLENSEEYHKSLLRSIPDLLFVLSKDGVFLDFRAQNHRLYVPPEDFIGKHIKDALPKSVSNIFLKSFTELGEKESVELRYSLSINNDLRHYRARVVALGEDRVIVLATDDTERTNSIRNIEFLLSVTKEQNERLKNFAHIVSHNLRSHSGSFSLLLEMMKDEFPEVTDNVFFPNLENVAKNLGETIEHLNEVVERSIDTNQKYVALNLKDQVDRMVESMQSLADDAKVRIHNLVDSLFTVQSIPAYLDSIILNCLTNGIKYRQSSEKESYVKISADRIDQYLVLSFEDNGIGFDMKKHGHEIFGMYKTFHGNADAKGIGLFITKNQIETMGGKISVESTLGKGSIFRVFFLAGE